jgi:phosphotransferase system enzyme I (PtsI)
MFAQMDDPYMKERAADINDVYDRVIKIIEGVEIQDLSAIAEDVVIVAYDLTPSQSSQLNPEFVKGFITEIGGKTSHAAIISRTLGIPAIVGVGEGIKEIEEGKEITIDGTTGEIFYEPDQETKDKAQAAYDDFVNYKKEIEVFRNAESISKDG